VVEDLNGLFEAYGDEDAEDDDEEVSEEFAARHGRVLRRMDVDHGWGFRSAASSVAMPPELGEMSMETMMKISIAI